MDNKRIDWIDISRGILIILMVVGHSTGLFNKYIYQFHMAAFFFLSGYVAHPEKKRFFHTLFDKFFTLLLPTIITILSGLAILWLLHLGNWDVLISSVQFPGWRKALTSFFIYGDIYVDVLGANWFLITLFGVCIFSKLIHLLMGRSIVGYLSISAVLYAVGYWIGKTERFPLPHIGMFIIDLVFIGNMFYALGYCLRESGTLEWVVSHKATGIFGLITTIACISIIAQYPQAVVDWPSHRFPNPILNGWSALNGIALIFSVSLLVNHFFSRAGKLLVYVGKNTLGILFFHFSFFKIMYLPFYLMGEITFEDISCITPGRMSTLILEKKYWFIIAIGSLLLSLAVWRLLLRNRIFRFLLGQDKHTYEGIWDILANTRPANRLMHMMDILSDYIKKLQIYVFETYKQNRLLSLSIALMAALVAMPLYKQGVMCNDELQARLWSMKGFAQFYHHYFSEHIAKGRALSTPIVSFTMYLGFIGSSNWSFKIVQIITIVLVLFSFSVFLFKVFRSKRFALLCGLSALCFLPVTFEHTVPNAFCALYNIPFCILLFSLSLFVDYLKNNKKRHLICSMLLLFITLISYESFVMFLPLYWGISIWEIDKYNRKEIFKKIKYPTMVSVIFLILYIFCGMVFSSNYTGNQIAEISVKNSLKIVFELVKASFPGYYIFAPKYKYLLECYNNLCFENYVRILFVCIVLGGILHYLLKSQKPNIVAKKGKWGVLGMGILCIILPQCPIAVAKMYQKNIGSTGFMALPTTFFTYLAAIFVCCFMIWQLAQKVSGNSRIFIIIGVVLYLFPIQLMNDVFARQQNIDFQRLTTIEALFSTELMELLDGQEIKSTDIFIAQNALAIHSSYWTEFARHKGKNIEIVNEPGAPEDICLYFDGTQFTLQAGKGVCIIVTKPQTGYGICQCGDKEPDIITFENPLSDNELYEYFYTISDKGMLVSSDKENFALELVGSDLESCIDEYGYYNDGWVAKSSQFQIKSGDKGEIDIEIYCPADDFHDKKIEIYVNDILADTIQVYESMQKICIGTEPNQIIRIKLETNFLQEDTGADTRELAMVILSMQGY